MTPATSVPPATSDPGVAVEPVTEAGLRSAIDEHWQALATRDFAAVRADLSIRCQEIVDIADLAAAFASLDDIEAELGGGRTLADVKVQVDFDSEFGSLEDPAAGVQASWELVVDPRSDEVVSYWGDHQWVHRDGQWLIDDECLCAELDASGAPP